MHLSLSLADTSSWPAGYGAYASSQPGNGGSVSPWGGKSNYTTASADDHLRGMFRAARDMAPTRHSPEGYGWEDADHERGPSPGRRGASRPLNTMYDRWVDERLMHQPKMFNCGVLGRSPGRAAGSRPLDAVLGGGSCVAGLISGMCMRLPHKQVGQLACRWKPSVEVATLG